MEQPLKINCPKNCVHIFMYPESNIFVPCLIISFQFPAEIDDLLDLTLHWFKEVLELACCFIVN